MDHTNNDRPPLSPIRRIASVLALCALVATLTATWLADAPASAAPPTTTPTRTAAAPVTTPDDTPAKPKPPKRSKSKQALRGKLNLNTATSDQLQMLPGVGPSKADRVVAWRQKNGGFKRIADLRKVKGFGYKTLKKLEPFLDIKGETTLAAE
jgi:competence protein ComEA